MTSDIFHEDPWGIKNVTSETHGNSTYLVEDRLRSSSCFMSHWLPLYYFYKICWSLISYVGLRWGMLIPDETCRSPMETCRVFIGLWRWYYLIWDTSWTESVGCVPKYRYWRFSKTLSWEFRTYFLYRF